MRLEKTESRWCGSPPMILLVVLAAAIAGGCEVFLSTGDKSAEEGAKAPGSPAADAPAPAEKPAEVKKTKKVVAESWPTWGGQVSRNMVNSFARGIPSEWDVETGKNIKWTTPLGSQSYGNPTIADGRIFVGTNNEGKRNPEIVGDKGNVMCFSVTDGELLWQAVHDKLRAGRVNDWPLQGICSSPFVDGDRIYYISNRIDIFY